MADRGSPLSPVRSNWPGLRCRIYGNGGNGLVLNYDNVLLH